MKAAAGLALRFLFDEHANLQALRALQARGVDVVQVADVGLRTAEDAVIFNWARREGRIVVTRNYQDYVPLVEQANRQGVAFAGVIFFAPSLPQGDVGAHIRALEHWIAQANAAGMNPAENTYVWIV